MSLWEKRSVLWVSRVRRAGMTCFHQAIPGIEYFDCELPRVSPMLDHPEAFLGDLRGRKVILHEIHRLGNPSEIVRIAADHYLDINIIATGLSSLDPSQKFRDTLTGRKMGSG